MKSVLIVAYHYPPEGGSSGVLRTLKFSKYLRAYGWVPHVLTLRETAYPVRDEGLSAQIPAEVVIHRTRGFDVASRLSMRGRYPGFLAVPDRFVSWLPFAVATGLGVIRSNRVDVLYSTSPQPTAHLIAVALKALTGIPWVADFRDPWIEDGLYPRPGSLRAIIESRLERMVINQADRITVTTPLFRQEVLRRYPELPPEKVRVLFNGYDEEDFERIKETIRTDRFEILHTGLVTFDYRDPRPFLKAVAALINAGRLPRAGVRVTFLGAGRYLESPSFREFVNGLGLPTVVEILPRVSYGESLRRLFQASVLLLLQASDDTRALIPAKAFEYLRAGRPILALTREGATADLIMAIRAGIVACPDDMEGMERALLDLYARRSSREVASTEFHGFAQYERKKLTGELALLFEEVRQSA